jgi:hypothetical protein
MSQDVASLGQIYLPRRLELMILRRRTSRIRPSSKQHMTPKGTSRGALYPFLRPTATAQRGKLAQEECGRHTRKCGSRGYLQPRTPSGDQTSRILSLKNEKIELFLNLRPR